MSVPQEVTIRLDPNEPHCPKCGATEMHPDGDKLLVRFYKVYDEKGAWSQCLVCSGYYNAKLELTESNHNPKKGWFCT